MREFCPESELIGGYVEGSLTADELWRIENHITVCDDCRREVALLHLHRSAPAEPAELSASVRQNARAAFDRQRYASSGTKRQRSVVARTGSPGVFAAAALFVLAAIGVLLWVNSRRQNQPVDEDVVEKPGKVAPKEEQVAEEKDLPKPPPREWPPQLPEPEREVTDQPKDEPKPEPKKDDPVVDQPRDEPKKPDDKKPPRETVARSYDSLTLTDLRGEIALRRKGQAKAEKAGGVVTVGNGDVLTADKPSSFNVEGKYAVVLTESSRVMMALVAKEEAAWLSVEKGGAVVDSGGNGGARWILTDGRSVVLVDRTRGKFGATRGEDGLAVVALSDGLRCQTEGGESRTLRFGDELVDGKVRKHEAPDALRGVLASHRPSERTLFYSADLKLGRFTLVEGVIEREKDNEMLRSIEKKKTQRVTIQFGKKIAWNQDLVVRFRYKTNARLVRVTLPLPGDKGSLITEIETNKKYVNSWVEVELPLDRFGITASGTIYLSPRDLLETFQVQVDSSAVYGDAKGYLLVDDIQFVDR